MDATMGSTCGVSRSGRVRKKPAKLMEMELAMDDRLVSLATDQRSNAIGGNSYVANKTAALSSALLGCSPLLHHGPTSPPPLQPSPDSAKRQSVSKQPTSLTLVQLVQPPPSCSTTTRVQTSDMSTSEQHLANNPRVIGMKALETSSPTFDHLSGSSTYLIGDDVHFITGEPVDSEQDVADDDDVDGQHRGYRLSPLKVDIGDAAVHPMVTSMSVNHGDDYDGIRMKFILSPKNSSSSSFDKGKGGQSKSKKSKKSSKSKKSTSSSRGGGGGAGISSSKSKKKKKVKQGDQEQPSMPINLSPANSFRGMPVLEDLAASGPPFSTIQGDSDSDCVDGESKLIIAEPPILLPMVPIGKSKKKLSPGRCCSTTKLKKKSSSSKSLQRKQQHLSFTAEIAGPNAPIAAEALGQQHSVYLKEKNASKKKAGKKAAKTKDKGPNYKARSMSAYMLWCREYRSQIVKENPGIDFSTISKRLGELWQSLSEYEKLNWRRKAKMTACKPATTSNVINTGKKRKDSTPKNGSAGRGGTGGKLHVRGTQAVVACPAAAGATSPCVADDAGEATGVVRPVGTTPLDVAAHLKLLGDSLSIIGQRLTEHEGQIAVSGSLSVLLDSTLCALGPLVCLTAEVDQLNGCPKPVQERILDNIAYIMPGL